MEETCHITPVIELPCGRLLRMTDGEGRSIAVFDGLVWITQSGDARDVFLRPGETFAFDRGGMALVEALSHARVAVCTGRAAGTTGSHRTTGRPASPAFEAMPS